MEGDPGTSGLGAGDILFLDLYAGSQGKTSLSCTLRIGVLFCTCAIRWYKVDSKKTFTQNTFKAESLCEGKEIHENCLANPILLNDSEMYSFQLFRLENLLFYLRYMPHFQKELEALVSFINKYTLEAF